MGFEAGQHLAESSVDHHEAVIWIAMVAAGNLAPEDLRELTEYRAKLASAERWRQNCRGALPAFDKNRRRIPYGAGVFEFSKSGTRSTVGPGTPWSSHCCESGVILLPLYQALGDDGFFLGREVRPFWLKLSAILRQLRVGDYFHWLPGVRRDPENDMNLVVNTRIARIMPLQIFHLLGFRKRRWNGRYLVVSRRHYDMDGPTAVHPF